MAEQDQIGRFVDHKDLRPSKVPCGLVRVIFQYEDGEVACLEGRDLSQYIGDIDSVIGLASVHFYSPLADKFLKVTWRVLNREEAANLLQQEPPSNPWDK